MGDKNDNGERLCDFSLANGLVITGTLFQHKRYSQGNMSLGKRESEESD